MSRTLLLSFGCTALLEVVCPLVLRSISTSLSGRQLGLPKCSFAENSRCLASLHGSEFVTPALVALAARKIYPHRLSIVSAAKERSMQYGSSLASVANMLRNFTPDSVIEEVLACVEAPL